MNDGPAEIDDSYYFWVARETKLMVRDDLDRGLTPEEAREAAINAIEVMCDSFPEHDRGRLLAVVGLALGGVYVGDEGETADDLEASWLG